MFFHVHDRRLAIIQSVYIYRWYIQLPISAHNYNPEPTSSRSIHNLVEINNNSYTPATDNTYRG